jgi:nucleoside-diphosphate-sugar epimerase
MLLKDSDVAVLHSELTKDLLQKCEVFHASSNETNKKVCIVISSLLSVWGKTPCSKGDLLDESDYEKRKAFPSFTHLKVMEDKLLALNSPSFSLYIVASGTTYGGGEEQLSSFFAEAWLANSKSLRIPSISSNNGSNYIPAIHVNDLAQAIIAICTETPSKKYIIAVDSSKITLCDIITTISKRFGYNSVVSPTDEELEDMMLDKSLIPFQVNLRFNSNNIVLNSLKMEWTAKSGFVEKIELIAKEYLAKAKLKPVRIVLMGAPGSGKTFWSNYINTTYELPKLTIKDIIEEARGSTDPEIVEALKTAGAPDARIPIPILAKIVKKILNVPLRRNRGWLDLLYALILFK